MTSYWLLVEGGLGPGEAGFAGVLRGALAFPRGEADRLLPLPRDLDERVRQVLLGVAGDPLPLVPPLHDQDGPGTARVRDLGLGGADHRVHVVDLQLARELLVLLEPVLAPAHVPGALEVPDLHLVLEARDHLLRLVGEAVALVLGEVPLLRVAGGQVVDGAQDAEHHEHDHEGVAAVLDLAAADASRHVLPAQQQVEDDEGEAPHEPGAEAAGQGLPPPLPGQRPHDDDEAEGGEEVDDLLQGVHGPRPSTAGSPPTGGRGRGRRR